MIQEYPSILSYDVDEHLRREDRRKRQPTRAMKRQAWPAFSSRQHLAYCPQLLLRATRSALCRPIYDYLASELDVPAEKITKAIVRRPSLVSTQDRPNPTSVENSRLPAAYLPCFFQLGLHVDTSLSKMVSYLLHNGTPKEKVIEYVLTTL